MTEVQEAVEELEKYDQWVAHDQRKVPYGADGKRAKSNEKGTWLPYLDAVVLCASGSNLEGEKLTGIGFEVAEEDPFTFVDLDGCRDPVTCEVTEEASRIIQQLDSYTEISPSGRGLHVWIRGRSPGSRKRFTKGLEIYSDGQYATWTGEHLRDTPTIINHRQQELEQLYHSACQPDDSDEEHRDHEHSAVDVPDDLIVEAAVRASSNGKFERLYNEGDTSDYPSPSEADLALASLLAFHTVDTAQIERIMRSSALYRQKWDKNREYLPRTVKKAVANRSAATQPRPKRRWTGKTMNELRTNPALLVQPVRVSRWLAHRGEVTLLSGREKDGKSTLAASDAKGALEQGFRVFWISAEEDANRIVSRFNDLAVDGDRLIIGDGWPSNWEDIEAAVIEQKPDVVYFDTLSSLVASVEKEIPENGQGEKWQALMLRFKRLAQSLNAGVVVLAHANRSKGEYRGSTGIGAGVDSIVEMRPTEKDDKVRKLIIKSRWERETCTVRYEGPHHGYMDASSPLKIDQARTFLRDKLRNGPVPKKECESGAKAQGISDHTLRRAFEAESGQAEMQRGKGGSFEQSMWSLSKLRVPASQNRIEQALGNTRSEK